MLRFFTRNKKPVSAVASQPRRTQLGVEELEGRLVPARIDILSTAYAVGTASLSNSSGSTMTRTNSVSLAGNSWTGTIKRVYATNNSLAESYAHLHYWNLSPQSKRIALTASANASGSFRNAWANVYTSPNYNSAQRGWIRVKVNKSLASEWIGKPVTVTLAANFQPTRYGNNNSSTYTDVRVGSGGSYRVILRGENLPYQSRTVTLNTKIGSVFYVHMTSYAKATSYSMAKAVTRLDITI